MFKKPLQAKPKGETDQQRIKRFAATGDPRYIALAKLYRAGVFPSDAETDFYMGQSCIRCWRLKRNVSPMTKKGLVVRYRLIDEVGKTYIPADKNALAVIRQFFTTKAAKASAQKAANKRRNDARAEAARLKAWKNRTPEQIAEADKRHAEFLTAQDAKLRAQKIKLAREKVQEAQAELAALQM